MSHKKTNKDPKKPKGLTTAYNYFTRQHRAEVQKSDPNRKINFVEFSKECAQLWKDMTMEEKQPFQDLSNEDRKRHAQEMKDYVPPEKEDKGTTKKKEVYDPNGPKRPNTALHWFSCDYASIIKSKNPEFKDKPKLAKELERRWNSMNEGQRAIYEAQSDRDRERYERELVIYKRDKKSTKLATNAKPTLSVDPSSSSSEDDDLF